MQSTFFPKPSPVSLDRIASLTGAMLADLTLGNREMADVAPLERAGPSDVSYFDNRRLDDVLARTGAGACFIAEANALLAPKTTALLVTPSPDRAFARLSGFLYPTALRPVPTTGETGVSARAHVADDAGLEPGVTVEACAVVGPGAEVGTGSVLCAGCVVGPNVRIGRNATIGPGATVVHALVGNDVVIHAGARIGQDGFGFVPGRDQHLRIPQIGRVIIQDTVEIGANTTVDRGSVRDTIIGEGTKIDNLVQIGHNCRIGRHCLIAGQVGISGSVTLGDFVMLGGNAGIRDHVTVGDGARVAAAAAVHANVPAGESWGGYPALRVDKWYSQMRTLQRLVRRASTPGTRGKSEDE